MRTTTIMAFGFLVAPLFLAGCGGVPGDAAIRAGHPEVGADHYKTGADQGDSDAALRLGFLIAEGSVPKEKYGTPVHWFSRACDLGSDAGCHNVGHAFNDGEFGEKPDYERAKTFYLRAAERGYPQSQYNLASMYSDRYLTGDVEGLTWMIIARQGSEQCKATEVCQWMLDDPPGHHARLRNRMSPEQIAEATGAANAWKPRS